VRHVDVANVTAASFVGTGSRLEDFAVVVSIKVADNLIDEVTSANIAFSINRNGRIACVACFPKARVPNVVDRKQRVNVGELVDQF